MKSRALRSFWRDYQTLPLEIQQTAIKQYKLWLENPKHSSLRFKKVKNYWSARVTDDYRAVGLMDKDTVIWFFIGTHAQYNRFLKRDK